MDKEAESGAKAKGKRLELSVAQVAGSALAAALAALLAGKLGVYGTVIGAGVVSVVATTGGTVFQHLFRRTGEQMREATVQAARPRTRQVPAPEEDRTRLMPQAAEPPARPAHSGAYSEGTLHGTRVRGWKRSLLAAGAVFVLAMGTLTVVELTSGASADGGGGTTIGQIIQRDKPARKQEQRPDSGDHSPGPRHSQTGNGQTGGPATPSPGASQPGGDTGKQSPTPSATPSNGDAKPSPSQTPGPSGMPDSGKSSGGAQTPPAQPAAQGSVS
ncbi:hypothetical protein ACIHFE_10605 [Streptomyces sp. NPDC052396]|uniref:hypothetical protein n=1 Tax=Streptomyces sp. NPDC052396 TaxID=3365689 RepID=UPI0037D754E6